MRYEQKMLVLSGEGKGIVTVERSANGVKFSLRTFLSMPYAGLKAGIITPNTVIIRDLPNTPSPSATFITDDLDLDKLHFAVFDSTLVLYGAFCQPMWESNVLSILHSHDRKTSQLFVPASAPLEALPKITEYGDDRLASGNFYTPFNIAARMPQVDAFLDGPRTLDKTALDGMPRVTPHETLIEPAAEVAAETEIREVEPETVPESAEWQEEDSTVTETAAEATETETLAEQVQNEVAQQNDPEQSGEGEFAEQPETEQTDADAENPADAIAAAVESAETQADGQEERNEQALEVAAEIDRAEPKRLPWEMESAYLSARGNRKPVRSAPRVSPVKNADTVKKLRDMQFFEKCRADIEKLFSSAPKDDALSGLLPDITWVKASLGSGHVSVGRSGDAFLCYAVAGTYSQVCPFGEDAQWLPTQKQSPAGGGYWLIFQSLATGEIIHTA